MKEESELANFVKYVLSYVYDNTAYRCSKKLSAQLITLSGELGSGKTTCIQYLARSLGVTQNVTSPTFVIMKEYKLENIHFDRFVHIDAYRLEKPEDMNVLGWAELLRDPRILIAIEWPERIIGLDDKTFFNDETVVALRFEILSNNQHRITTNTPLYE